MPLSEKLKAKLAAVAEPAPSADDRRSVEPRNLWQEFCPECYASKTLEPDPTYTGSLRCNRCGLMFTHDSLPFEVNRASIQAVPVAASKGTVYDTKCEACELGAAGTDAGILSFLAVTPTHPPRPGTLAAHPLIPPSLKPARILRTWSGST